MSTTTAAAPAVTDEQRAARLALAESLWTVKKDLNRDDVHGVLALATSGPGSAYSAVTEALLAVVLTLVDDDHDRADEVMFHLLDNYESVAYNLALDAEQHARRAGARVVADAARAKLDAVIAREESDLSGWEDVEIGRAYLRVLRGLSVAVTGDREVTITSKPSDESWTFHHVPSEFLDNSATEDLLNAEIVSGTWDAVITWDAAHPCGCPADVVCSGGLTFQCSRCGAVMEGDAVVTPGRVLPAAGPRSA